MDPRARVILLLCAGLSSLALEGPRALLLFALLGLLSFGRAGPDRGLWLRAGLGALALIWGTTLTQALFYAPRPRTPLFALGPVVLWREGLHWGLAQSLRFVGLLFFGLALVRSTPVDRLYLALRRLGLPFGLALMAATALRFLPVVAGELRAVRRARRSRGRAAWRRSPGAWLRLELALLVPVVARCWRRAQALAESLDARGFDPLGPRGTLRPLVWRGRDGLAVAAGLLLALGLLGARGLYLLYTAELLDRPELRGLYALVRRWL